MSKNAEQLLKKFVNYEQLANESLEATAKKKEKKLDPKAKVRNRGTVCVPAESAKDKKDHFPINDEAQARNALARVHQYSSAPDWYKGSLQGLQALVARKVKAKYPKIDVGGKKKDKKATLEYIDTLLVAYAQGAQGTPKAVWNPKEVPDTPEERAKFLNAPIPYQGSPQAGGGQQRPGRAPAAQTEGVNSAAVQQTLVNNHYNLGQTGQNRNGVDGDWGRLSDAALQKYMVDFKVPQGTTTKAVKEYLANGGVGPTPWQQAPAPFNYETINAALGTAVAALTKYQEQSKNSQINAQGAGQIKAYVTQVAQQAAEQLKSVQDKKANGTEAEKKQAAELEPKLNKLLEDINGEKGWIKYLATFPVATWTTAKLNLKRFEKYAQAPLDPKWVGAPAQPAAQQGQPAPQAQQGGGQPVAQPAARQPAVQQGQPAQQAQPAAQVAQLSEANKKKWISWIEKEAEVTHDMIYASNGFLGIIGVRGGIKDFYDQERFTQEVLEDIQDNIQGLLESANSALPIKDQLGQEPAQQLHKVINNCKIILERLGKEIEKRKQAEARADRMSRRRF